MREEKGSFAVATFHSTYSVLKTEKLLKDAGLEKVRLIPVPSSVSSDCGITVRFLRRDLGRVRPLLAPVEDDLEGLFVSEGDRWVPVDGDGSDASPR